MFTFICTIVFILFIFIFRYLSDSKDKSSPTDSINTSNNNESNTDSDISSYDQRSRYFDLTKLPIASNSKVGKYLVFDVETTGFPIKRNERPEATANWPYVVEIAWILIDEKCRYVDYGSFIINQQVSIPSSTTMIHGITTQMATDYGLKPKDVYLNFIKAVDNCEYLVGHNLAFDLPIVECDLVRNGFGRRLETKKRICTMKSGRNEAAVFNTAGNLKNPKLTELYGRLFHNNPYYNLSLEYNLHSASDDTLITLKCFTELRSMHSVIIEDYPFFSKIENNLNTLESDGTNNTIERKSKKRSTRDPQKNKIEYLKNLESIDGKGVLVTGTLFLYDREQAEALIEQKGGIRKRSISSKVDYVIIGESAGWAKLEKIESMQNDGHHIKGITPEVFYEFIDQ